MHLWGHIKPVLLLIPIMTTLTACTREVDERYWTAPAYMEQSATPVTSLAVSTTPPEAATPTSFQLPATRDPNTPILLPTPDLPHGIPTPVTVPESYIVQPGDTIGTIARKFGLRPESIVQANSLVNPNYLEVGQVLALPSHTATGVGPSFKIIPDSELIFGPFNMIFDTGQFIQNKAGYLSTYSEEVDGKMMTGTQIVERIAREYSVNPKLLLAVLDYQAGWVSNSKPNPGTQTYPLGFDDGWHTGLYKQLAWGANMLNYGFYGWQVDAISQWTLADGTILTPDATINAGTAGVQHFFAQVDDYATWQNDVNLNGLFATYYLHFGYPFDYTFEPILPPGLTQPTLSLPFGYGETWNFTGGPHGGWDTGSAWAALDFAPPGEGAGCTPSGYWVTAVADGPVIRSDNGVVIQDLDGDGREETGWTILYLHIDSQDRVPPGAYLLSGDRVGHPSCEGGVSNATHLHLARRYNGMWIAADGQIPFILDGYISSGTGIEYDGYLTRGTQQILAWDGYNEVNQISR
jgi:murein DD-endopeptidase MepM/ murein hydrolase activator NlpD